MIAAVGRRLNRFSRRWVPDPFVLALVLTVVVIAVALVKLSTADAAPEGGTFWTVMGGWANGVKDPNLLAFALKMCLILVTGHALALSPIVQESIAVIARVPRTAAAATVMVALVACVSGLVHWGLGAITGALLAREIGRHAAARGLKIHYPLLGAAAYAGMAVWHGGLSGSAPLTVAAEGHFTAELIGVVAMSDTVFSPLNLIITGTLVAVICGVFWALTPKDASEYIAPDPGQLAPLPSRDSQPIDSAVHWLQESWTCGAVIGTAGMVFVAWSFATDHMKLDLDSIILVFLFLGIALQGSLRHFVEAIADGARGAGAIILQFPFYFGILGVMKASGLVAAMSDLLVDVSSKATLPIATFISAGMVNMFVPSGGGQWAVQGDILLTAGNDSGVDPATIIMAFSYGDAWTNMLQPFWALPLLGIMGLRARDIIGYTAVIFFAMGIVVPALLLALG